MKNKLLLTILLCIQPVFDSLADNDQVPLDRTITIIHTYDTFAFVRFTPNFESTQGCTATDANYKVAIDMTNELGKQIYSAALAAATAKKKVGFGVTGCLSNRPKLYRIDVRYD